jgi:hypothetical protein
MKMPSEVDWMDSLLLVNELLMSPKAQLPPLGP